jgi:adenosylmethionine-8-amino-7-oxononanoate aminotransferase
LLPGRGLEEGVVGDLLRLAPPFISKEEEIKRIYGILEKIIQEVAAEKR